LDKQLPILAPVFPKICRLFVDRAKIRKKAGKNAENLVYFQNFAHFRDICVIVVVMKQVQVIFNGYFGN